MTDTPHIPHAVDIYVGSRIRARRQEVRLSQTELANGLGLTFQQVQKYERGANRISASRLYDTARVLGVPVEYFFDGLPNVEHEAASADMLAQRTLLEQPGVLSVAKAFAKMTKPQRDSVVAVAGMMVGA